MVRQAMDVCLRLLKESNKSRFDSYSVRNSTCCGSYPILPFGIFARSFYPTTFLEIAVVTINELFSREHFAHNDFPRTILVHIISS